MVNKQLNTACFSVSFLPYFRQILKVADRLDVGAANRAYSNQLQIKARNRSGKDHDLCNGEYLGSGYKAPVE
jgi:hypothetical protein